MRRFRQCVAELQLLDLHLHGRWVQAGAKSLGSLLQLVVT
jgi:hypothetical protein